MGISTSKAHTRQKSTAIVAQSKGCNAGRYRVPREEICYKEKTMSLWKLIEGDCCQKLKKWKERPTLIVADPPYNQGLDYGGSVNDNLSTHQYHEWTQRWLQACVNALDSKGSLWVIISDEWAAEIASRLNKIMHRRNWIKWYETFGANCTHKFNRTSRHILYYVKDPKQFIFCPHAVSRPSDRQTKYNDKRANPAGKIWDDVWQIPRVAGRHAERIEGVPTQIPLAITRAIISCASYRGDLVVDPFCGSASTGVACIELDRRFIGIEKEQRFCSIGRKRLREAEENLELRNT